MTKKAAKKKVGKTAARKKTATRKAGKAPGEQVAKEDAPKSESQEDRSDRPKADDEVKPTASASRSNRVVRPEGAKSREGENRSRSGRRGRREGGKRPRIDEEELGKKAWKVFQHEIAEEGLALIDEGSARALAEKSILVARAFLEERARRLGRQAADGRGRPGEGTPKGDDQAPVDKD